MTDDYYPEILTESAWRRLAPFCLESNARQYVKNLSKPGQHYRVVDANGNTIYTGENKLTGIYYLEDHVSDFPPGWSRGCQWVRRGVPCITEFQSVEQAREYAVAHGYNRFRIVNGQGKLEFLNADQDSEVPDEIKHGHRDEATKKAIQAMCEAFRDGRTFGAKQAQPTTRRVARQLRFKEDTGINLPGDSEELGSPELVRVLLFHYWRKIRSQKLNEPIESPWIDDKLAEQFMLDTHVWAPDQAKKAGVTDNTDPEYIRILAFDYWKREQKETTDEYYLEIASQKLLPGQQEWTRVWPEIKFTTVEQARRFSWSTIDRGTEFRIVDKNGKLQWTNKYELQMAKNKQPKYYVEFPTESAGWQRLNIVHNNVVDAQQHAERIAKHDDQWRIIDNKGKIHWTHLGDKSQWSPGPTPQPRRWWHILHAFRG